MKAGQCMGLCETGACIYILFFKTNLNKQTNKQLCETQWSEYEKTGSVPDFKTCVFVYI